MMMEDQCVLMNKRKRTKRQRPMSPLILTMATTTSSSCTTGGDHGVRGGGDGCDLNLSCGGGGSDRFIASSSSSPSNNSSEEFIQSKADEEDMANCLMLLAQGRRDYQSSTTPPPPLELFGAAKTTPQDDAYECKTCNRRFHSFQALGGHRASHRKPKQLTLSDEHPEINKSPTLLLHVSKSGKDSCHNNNNNNNKSRVHECLICGAEFSSGQALGGHMRRHRPLTVAGGGGASSSTTHDDGTTHQEVKKSRLDVLGLDLNLPAPPEVDDHQQRPVAAAASVFSFASKDQVPVFATSQLVHCHY